MRLLRYIVISSVLAAGISQTWAAADGAIPDYQQVVASYRASDVLVYDAHGAVLDRIRTDFHGRRGDWLSLAEVSPALLRAVILSEDQRFYEHTGVDWQAMLGAAWGNVLGHGRRGASTISMQLTGLLNGDLHGGSAGRSVQQKIDQIVQTRELELSWSKQQILEAYLNLAAFRGELVGIDALSRVMFRKHASGLNARESALAAVMLRAPNATPAVLLARACAQLTQMGRSGECAGLSDFIARVSQRTSGSWADSHSLAPHFSRRVLSQVSDKAPSAPTIRTTLDAELQRLVLFTVDQHVRELSAANVSDAAVVVLDNETGAVLAYVGSTAELSSSPSVDHAQAMRQAGSTLKPFLYAQAIGQERLTTTSLLQNSPLNLPTGNGLYIPQNYDKQFTAWASVRTALAASLNIPAVRVLLMVRAEPFAQLLKRMGLPLDERGDFYGYSLALGSADVTLMTLTNAYRALANQGRYSEVTMKVGPPPSVPSEQVLSAGAAWIVADILADRQARTATFGLDSPLSTPFWSAVKTGTSKDMRDNWCIGWTQRYTVGVWVGNSGGASMRDVSGVSGAGPIWHDIVSWLHREQDSEAPRMPESVTGQYVDFQDDMEPARYDFFLGDTAVTHVGLAHKLLQSPKATPRIVSPVNGTLFAIDPDIPSANQRIMLQAQTMTGASTESVSWRAGQRVLGYGAKLDWAPAPGEHLIELLDEEGRVLHQVTIRVRGTEMK